LQPHQARRDPQSLRHPRLRFLRLLYLILVSLLLSRPARSRSGPPSWNPSARDAGLSGPEGGYAYARRWAATV
ncbi:hypothetical protein E4U19_003996, partial [Claviceps sp. Clav32 group G5]